jgi:hypothetical protein
LIDPKAGLGLGVAGEGKLRPAAGKSGNGIAFSSLQEKE